jgi:hypothetical protein
MIHVSSGSQNAVSFFARWSLCSEPIFATLSITGDESWFYLEYQHASQWSVPRHKVPQMAGPAIDTAKFMLTAIWGVNGFHLLDLTPSQCRFNA